MIIHWPLIWHGLVRHRSIIWFSATHRHSTGTRIYHCTACHISYYCYYRYLDARYTVISWSHIPVTYAHHTSVHACIVSHLLSYDSPCILHKLLFHVPVFMLYDCFLLLIWIFSILDMRAVDMRYVESHIYCSCYIVPVILFPLYCSRFPLYCSMLSTELWSSYHVIRIMYC